MISLQTTYDAFKAYKKDISDVGVDLFIQWCNYAMSMAYDRITSTTPDKLRKDFPITLSGGGNQTIALPSDFGKMSNWQTGVYLLDNNGLPRSTLAMNNYGESGTGYYLTPTSIVITNAPTDTQAAILRYTPKMPVFTSLSDYYTDDKTITGVPIYNDWDLEFTVRAVDIQYTMWDEDIAMEPIADQRFVRILSEMLERQRQTPNVYKIDPYVQGF